jgi:hypothetical protein
VVAVVEESGAPPPLVVATAVEEGRTTMETAASQAALEPPAEAGLGGVDVVMVPSDEDSAPPLPAGDHDVAMTSAPVPSPAEVPEPSPAVGAAEPSSVTGTVTVEEVMELAMR